MRISDWSSDVCSSDLLERVEQASGPDRELDQDVWHHLGQCAKQEDGTCADYKAPALSATVDAVLALIERALGPEWIAEIQVRADGRSEEHTSELQSLMRISYAVFCLKKKTTKIQDINTI